MTRSGLAWLAVAIVVGGGLVAVTSVARAQRNMDEEPAASAEGLTASNHLPNADVVKAFIAGRTAKNWEPPKTPWGDPDIQGNFTTKDEANTPFERPQQWAGRRIEDITQAELDAAIEQRQQEALEFAPFFGGGEPEDGVAIAVPIHWFDNLAAVNSRPWFVIDPPDGKVPPLTSPAAPAAATLGGRGMGGRRDTYLDRSLGDRCIAWGAWRLPTIYGNSYQILQARDYVVLRQEQVHEARIVPLGDRPQLDPRIRSYLGHARGHWEGNTLVVVTANFHPQMTIRGFGGRGGNNPVGNLRLIERFTRIAPKKVEWTMTFDDATVWTRPWTFSLPMTEDDQQIIHEYACHEGNYGLANILSAGRMADRQTKTGTH